MAQKFTMQAVAFEDLNLVSSNYVRWLIIACTSHSWESEILFWSQRLSSFWGKHSYLKIKQEQDELTLHWKDPPDDLSESDSVAWFAFLWSSHLPSQPSNCKSLNICLQLCLFFSLNAHRYKHLLTSLNLIKYIVIFYTVFLAPCVNGWT